MIYAGLSLCSVSPVRVRSLHMDSLAKLFPSHIMCVYYARFDIHQESSHFEFEKMSRIRIVQAVGESLAEY